MQRRFASGGTGGWFGGLGVIFFLSNSNKLVDGVRKLRAKLGAATLECVALACPEGSIPVDDIVIVVPSAVKSAAVAAQLVGLATETTSEKKTCR